MTAWPLRASLAGIALMLMTACATIAPPRPPSLDLPLPPTDLLAVRKGDRVTLTWTTPTATTDRQTVRALGPTRICRAVGQSQGLHFTECVTPVGAAPAVSAAALKNAGKKSISTYTDTLAPALKQDPGSAAAYAVEVLNPDGRAAGLSNIVRVPALAAAPPPALSAKLTKSGVELSWTEPALAPASDAARYFDRIYRRQDGSDHSDLVGEFPAGTAEAVDRNFEWEKTYFYRATTVIAISLSEPCKNSGMVAANCPESFSLEGEDTPEIRIFADDVFPPAVPSGLQAVSSGPGQAAFVDLIWAPVPDVDLDGYNVYRREEGGAAVKVNKELVKTPAYRDTDVASGKSYLYSVSAVDVRGNESARSDEAGERVP